MGFGPTHAEHIEKHFNLLISRKPVRNLPTEFSSSVFKKLLDSNGFRAHARRTYWKVFQSSNPSEKLEDQKSIIGKMIRTNKKRKQSCFASNRIVFFAQNKNTYQIKPLFDKK